MAARFQLTFDCADLDRQARFWAEALGYRLEDPPAGCDDWDAYWRSVGVPEEELGAGVDSIVDPDDAGPRIWFQKVSEGKTVKNRIHVDLHASGGRDLPLETRKERVDAEVARLVALGATRRRTLTEPGMDRYAVAMSDLEDNEFDINRPRLRLLLDLSARSPLPGSAPGRRRDVDGMSAGCSAGRRRFTVRGRAGGAVVALRIGPVGRGHARAPGFTGIGGVARPLA